MPNWAAALLGLVALIAVTAAFWSWNIIKHPLERYASAATGRQVTIGGDVDVELSWATHVTLNHVSVANPSWRAGDMARIERIDFDIQLVPLIAIGAAVFPTVHVDRPVLDLVREADGRANWRFGEDGDGGAMQLPIIGRMLITNGRVHVNDKRHAMVFDGRVESREGPAGEAAHAFVLRGGGTLSGRPFTATMTGNSPLRADRQHPYAFDAHIAMAGSRLDANGTLPRPFDLDEVTGSLKAAGPDMADLYLITGLVFPNTPPYRLHGQLTRTNDLWRVAKLSGLIGHTDVAGQLSVDATAGRPFLRADVASRKADIDDITTLFGAHPNERSIPAGTKSARSSAAPPERSAVAETIGLLPDEPLRVDRVRRMDARVHYTAAEHRDGRRADEGSRRYGHAGPRASRVRPGLGAARARQAGGQRAHRCAQGRARRGPGLDAERREARGVFPSCVGG